MVSTLSGTMSDRMLDIVEQYLAQGGETPIDLGVLAQFAIQHNYWQGKGTAANVYSLKRMSIVTMTTIQAAP